MSASERQAYVRVEIQFPQESLDPHHFYAAYVFDQAETRQHDIVTILEETQRLNYPVRYWWLSDAIDLQGEPDRLIVCVHHPARDENAGMDLYTALQERHITWDDLDAAVVEEYGQLGRPVKKAEDIYTAGGINLFPLLIQREGPPPLSDGSNG